MALTSRYWRGPLMAAARTAASLFCVRRKVPLPTSRRPLATTVAPPASLAPGAVHLAVAVAGGVQEAADGAGGGVGGGGGPGDGVGHLAQVDVARRHHGQAARRDEAAAAGRLGDGGRGVDPDGAAAGVDAP